MGLYWVNRDYSSVKMFSHIAIQCALTGRNPAVTGDIHHVDLHDLHRIFLGTKLFDKSGGIPGIGLHSADRPNDGKL